MITKSCEVICILTFHNEACIFTKGKTYNAIYDPVNFNKTFNTRIYQDENNFISFHIASLFNNDEVTRHFITLAEYRKQKLIKIKCSK